MTDIQRLLPALAAITPAQLSEFLHSHGFSSTNDRTSSNGIVYLNAAHQSRLLVPTEPNGRNYAQSLLGIIEYFATATFGAEDVLAELVLGRCDAHEFSLMDSSGAWGLVSAGVLSSVAGGMVDFWKYSAAGVVTRRDQYTATPAAAEQLIRESKFGQTDYGSYKLRFYTPLTVSVDQDLAEVSMPLLANPVSFAEEVTSAVHANLAFLSSANGAILDQKPATLNRNAVAAAARMFPESVPDAKLVSKSAPNTSAVQEGSRDRESTLNSQSHRQIQRVSDYFANRLDFFAVDAQGYVVDLHRDRPGLDNNDATTTQRVVCDVSIKDVGWRKLQLHLDPISYSRAVKLHEAQQLIRLSGLVDKRTLPWTLTSLKIFEAVLGPKEFDTRLF